MEHDVAVGRHEFGDEAGIGAALDRDPDVEGGIEARELVVLGMEHREGPKLAADQNPLGRMRRCSPVDHKGNRLAEAALFQIKNRPVEARPVQPGAAHGHWTLKSDVLASRRAAALSASRSSERIAKVIMPGRGRAANRPPRLSVRSWAGSGEMISK